MIRKEFFGKTVSCFALLGVAALILVVSLASAGGLTVGEVRYTSQRLRDPFESPFDSRKTAVPASVTGYSLSHLRVQGMVWGSKAPQAIVNDTIVRIGEVIGEAEIVDIRKEGVYVLYKGQQYMLRPNTIK